MSLSDKLGNCREHSRVYEGLCTTCLELVCPSCVISGSHRKHDVLSLEQGIKMIREQMLHVMNRRILDKDFTENKILRIRENKLLMEKYREDTVKKIEEIFKGMTRQLKIRKILMMEKVNDKFMEELKKIEQAEVYWTDKQKVSEKIVAMKDKSDTAILANTKVIVNGVKSLKSIPNFQPLKVYDNINTNFIVSDYLNTNGSHVDKFEITKEELCGYLSDYIKLGKPNVLYYKA